ncbi:substrate-binding domain-containing protein [Streptomyces sp. NPDC046759]|uniref:substrate-binding domain-containing protein n=1 Tax=Streptomyces sp. NPDC046759 TaxID=3155019 RepID=UPI0033F14222
MCASDPLALGAVRAMRRRGLSVLSDVSVLGFDDSAFMNCTEPPLAVHGPSAHRGDGASGGRAAPRPAAGQAVPRRRVLFEPELVLRGSTAPPPAG